MFDPWSKELRFHVLCGIAKKKKECSPEIKCKTNQLGSRPAIELAETIRMILIGLGKSRPTPPAGGGWVSITQKAELLR